MIGISSVFIDSKNMEKFVCLLAIALCGASALSFDAANRITSGNVARENQFPYVISLQYLSELQTITRGHRCGGVMITLQHVLTAASCTFNTVNGALVPINHIEYRVFAGAVHLTNDNNQDRVRFIANFTVHPEFIGAPAYVNDIAIITLNAPFANTTVIPLPLPYSDFGPSDFTLCAVAGWGSQNITSTASIDLMYTTKYIYNQNVCTSLYSTQAGIVNILPNMLCAASYDIVSAGCIGDQGNALVCNGGLAGILFLTTGCSPSSFPEVYVRLSNYTTWIRSITGGTSAFQPGIAVLIAFTIVQLIASKVIS